MKNIWIIVSCIFLIIIIGQYIHSKEKKNILLPLNFQKQTFKGGSYSYHLNIGDSTILDVGFFCSGELSYVSNFPKFYEQTVFYHKEDGTIQSKLKKNSLNKTFGRTYYFHKNSGNLSSMYNYANGVKTGSAVSYHDSSDHVKEVMLYNDKGELYYRKTFDWQGNHIKTEGSKK